MPLTSITLKYYGEHRDQYPGRKWAGSCEIKEVHWHHQCYGKQHRVTLISATGEEYDTMLPFSMLIQVEV